MQPIEHHLRFIAPYGLKGDITITELPGKRDALEAVIKGKRRRYEGSVFHALLDLRRDLEQEGKRLLCAGACINAWPSALSGEAGLVYKRRLGRSPRSADLIEIFAPADPATIGTVQQQIDFREKLLEHLRAVLAARGMNPA